MGSFGFICKGCNSAIRSGENCVLIHVRHGKELGRVVGHYDEYGSVQEEEFGFFNEDEKSKNNRNEIIQSMYNEKDSYIIVCEDRLYKNKIINFSDYLKIKSKQDIIEADYDVRKLKYYKWLRNLCAEKHKGQHRILSLITMYSNYCKAISVNDIEWKTIFKNSIAEDYSEFIKEMGQEIYNNKRNSFVFSFNQLPKRKLQYFSGIVGYHKKCYKEAIQNGTFKLIPSCEDPNQSWGLVRKKYL